MGPKICYLKYRPNPENKITLLNKTPVILGRNRETGVEDLHVSREQVECHAEFDTEKVIFNVLGQPHSGCDGYALVRGETYTLKHGDHIELRLGAHEFEVVFEKEDEEMEDEVENGEMDVEEMEVEEVVEPAPKKPRIDQSSFVFSKNKGTWEEIDNKGLLVYTPDNCPSQRLVAAFDLDGTLVRTKSGAKWPKNSDDWKFYYNYIPEKLKAIFEEKNYKIVIFTNQAGLKTDSHRISEFKKKVEAIITKLELPVQVFISTGQTFYRKPAPGMWNAMKDKNNEDIDMTESFYVGDAAGRPKDWAPKKTKDHSCCDRLFAINLGLKFYTPEEYFAKTSPNPFIMPPFDPRKVVNGTYPQIHWPKFEVILMVGSPASGKSFYCKSQLVPKGYAHVSRDVLKSWQKCVLTLEEDLKKRQSVVVDNTNPNKEDRQRYIDVANKLSVPCRCFWMDVSLKHAKHNNRFREITDKSHTAISEIVLNSFNKRFEEPDLSEGFTEIIRIPFIPKFNRSEHEQLYRTFLLED